MRLCPAATPAGGTATWRLVKNPDPLLAVPTFLTKAIPEAPGVGVTVGVGVTGGVGVTVGVSVMIGAVAVFVGVFVRVLVAVFVGVRVGVAVRVFVGVLVGVAVRVLVAVRVGVLVGVAVGGTGVNVGVFVGATGVFVGGTGVNVGVLVGATGVFVGVLVGVTGVFVGVFVGVLVRVGVGVAVCPEPTQQTKVDVVSETLSTRTPDAPAAATLLSVAARHFNLTFCPPAAAGRLIVEVM